MIGEMETRGRSSDHKVKQIFCTYTVLFILTGLVLIAKHYNLAQDAEGFALFFTQK